MAKMLIEHSRWTCVQCGQREARCACRDRAANRRNRFGNVAQRTVYNGVTYDSKAEAEWAWCLYWNDLIHATVRQVTIPLGPDFKTRVDFLVFTAPGSCHVDEVKGVETARFKIVRRLWPKYGPCELHVLKKRGNTWDREVIPGKQGDE